MNNDRLERPAFAGTSRILAFVSGLAGAALVGGSLGMAFTAWSISERNTNVALILMRSATPNNFLQHIGSKIVPVTSSLLIAGSGYLLATAIFAAWAHFRQSNNSQDHDLHGLSNSTQAVIRTTSYPLSIKVELIIAATGMAIFGVWLLRQPGDISILQTVALILLFILGFLTCIGRLSDSNSNARMIRRKLVRLARNAENRSKNKELGETKAAIIVLALYQLHILKTTLKHTPVIASLIVLFVTIIPGEYWNPYESIKVGNIVYVGQYVTKVGDAEVFINLNSKQLFQFDTTDIDWRRLCNFNPDEKVEEFDLPRCGVDRYFGKYPYGWLEDPPL